MKLDDALDESPGDRTVRPQFESLSSGLMIRDPVDNVRFAVYTPRTLSPRVADPDQFLFPVDAAVSFRTDEVVIPSLVNVIARTRTGDLVADFAPTEDECRIPSDARYLELSSTPMKLYVAVERGGTVRRDGTDVVVDFDGTQTLRLGARSFHDSPSGTITVTDDARDAMAAVSLLGSALKTTRPERSFDTLRGHPPLVERGETFSVPDGIEAPDTGVELVVPPEREAIYAATSLAFYLGAEVVPGRSPRLVAGDFEHSLDGPGGYERAVNRTLQQVFFLDCLTRTEGYYSMRLHEREQVDPLVDLDFAALYDRPLAAQLPEYLSVGFETLEPHVPRWHLTTDVVPTAANVEVLPFVASDLALVRCPPQPTATASVSPPKGMTDFYRGVVARSTDDAPAEDVIQLNSAETVEHAWVGKGYPLGANKVTADAYRRRIHRDPPEQESITIRVVCNDPEMREEGVVEEFYGFRDLLTYDVDIAHDLSTDELADLLSSPIDLLHYVGHVDRDGIQCPDGVLDARTLDDVGVRAFVLNACRSYEQGAALVERGSYAGVATLSEVSNDVATRVGQVLARLLNCGYTLRSALAVAREQTMTGYRYVTLGDGGVALCQTDSGAADHVSLERTGPDEYLVTLRTYLTPEWAIGTTFLPYVGDNDFRYLCSGVLGTFKASADELDEYFNTGQFPIEFEEKLYWSQGTSVSDL